MQAKTLLQIGFTHDSMDIYRREDDLEHYAQADLAARPANKSLGSMRAYILKNRVQACRELKRQRTKELEDNVERWDEFLKVYTKGLGEGKLPDGTYVNEVPGVRGIAARCALAKLKARGRDPTDRSPMGAHPNPTCVHWTKLGRCQMISQLAMCYYCHQPLCPDHRVSVGEAKERDGKRLGGASCRCQHSKCCKWRQNEQMRVLLGEGTGAQGTKRKRDETTSAPATSRCGTGTRHQKKT